MMKRILALLILLATLLCLCSCSNTNTASTFTIYFIDVGQGDSALVECDGHYMLIDGGDTGAGSTVYDFLVEREIQKLDILAVSHLHRDHYGGLTKALTYAQDIGLTISNRVHSDSDKDSFNQFAHTLAINGSEISVPEVGQKYKLGSATVEVIDVRADKGNDSMVLLVSFGDTTFLFTGDMEQQQESQLCDRYNDEQWDISLLKVGHHGSKTSTSIRFLRMLMPHYAVISVGKGHQPDHPSQQTLDRLEQADVEVFRTDEGGTVMVVSNGKEVSVKYLSY